jgi:hypothetical protein
VQARSYVRGRSRAWRNHVRYWHKADEVDETPRRQLLTQGSPAIKDIFDDWFRRVIEILDGRWRWKVYRECTVGVAKLRP